MSNPINTAPGWYPETSSGATVYWDGTRWTGDSRPPRKAFAAKAAHKGWGIGLIVFGALSVISAFSPTSTGASTASPFTLVIVGAGLLAWGIYLLRGQGPTTKAVEARLAAERQAQLAQATATASAQTGVHIVVNAPDNSAAAAQIRAIADPQTAKALQNLQNLLYTRAITDAEYQAAKNKLLGDLSS